jgi:NhaA family Na+:H+ antiporter
VPSPEPDAYPHQPDARDGSFVVAALRQETVGGLILVAATVVALAWANSPWKASYETVRDFAFGPHVLGMHLTVQQWTAEGLLAVFFFVAGLELKREVTVGSLARPAQAVLPVVAAVCGMTVPAVIFLIVTFGDPAAAKGWAVPTATDLAFCLAVLAITGQAIPSSLRAFLLTLAVVDDVLAIVLIALLFSDGIRLLPLLGSVAAIATYGILQRHGVDSVPLLVGLGLIAWALMLDSGVPPTVEAVALGLVTRVRPAPSPVERFEYSLRPLSAGVCVPLFALFSVGISLSPAALSDALHDRAAWGVVLGRVIGKTIGVFGGAWLVVRLTGARLAPDLEWPDLFALATLTGIGFAVPLLVSGEAYGVGSARDQAVTMAILASALISAILASILLRRRHRHHRQVADAAS